MNPRLPELLTRWREGSLSPADQADLLALVRGSEEARRAAADDRLLDRWLSELGRPALDADQVLRAVANSPGSLAVGTLAVVRARTSWWHRIGKVCFDGWETVRRRFASSDGARRSGSPWPRLAYLGSACALLVLGLGAWWLFRPAPPVAIGELIAVVGQPVVQDASGRPGLNPGPATPIHLGDRLETGDADRLEIRFRDGTTLRLGFNTLVELRTSNAQRPTSNGVRPAINSQPSAPPSPPTRPSEIHLLQGQIWTKVQTLTNAPEYAIRTDVATAVARGTEFGVRLQRERPTSNVQRPTPNGVPSNLLAVLSVKEGTVDFFNSFGTVQATAMTESTATMDSAPTEPRRLETLQVVRLDSGATWSLLTSPLDWPEAAHKLVGGGGSVGWQLRDVPGADGRTEVRISRLPSSSSAARAGLRLGDAIVAVDGQAVTHARQVSGAAIFRPGGAVNLRVRRDTAEETIAVTVSAETSLLRGPVLSADASSALTELLREWLIAPEDPALDLDVEKRRLEQATSLSRPSAFARKATADESGTLSHRMGGGRGEGNLRAAAFNQLGVLFELEDALGPAIRAYGRAVYLEPDVPLYRFNLALALRKIGSVERALEEFQESARLEPESIPARKRVAEVASLLGRHEESLALTDALLEAAPQDHSLWEIKAQLLFKLQRSAEAVAAARHAAELDPDCPVSHSYVAEALQAAGKLNEALAAWTEALDRAPFEPAFIANLGTVQRDLGQPAAAEQSFRRAVALQPNFALAQFNLGNLLADRRDFVGAAAAFEQACQLDPADARAHWRLGDMATKLREFDRAERAYRDALDLSPNDPEALFGLGELYRLQRRLAEAERAYSRAIELRPNYAAAYTALGIVFYERGDVDEAERFYRRAIELDPSETAPYHNLGTLYREARGDLDAAERWFRQALERAPDDGESLGGLGLVAMDRGNVTEAERLLRRAVEQAPESSALQNNLGEVLRHRGRADEAEPLYRKALELDPDNPAPYGNLGILLAERKQFAEAEKTFRALLERSSGNARLPALVNLAMVCGEQGKPEEAEGLLRQALELAPDHPQVSNALAVFLADHQLKLDEALTLATRALQAAPDDPQFLDTLGWVQAQRGDLEAAERTLQRALDLAGQEPPVDEIRKHLEQVREINLKPRPNTSPDPIEP